jgi:two-component system, NtrC family, response regulator
MNRNTILIVEDERKIREVLSRILEIEGYDVLVAEKGLQGMELLNKNEIKLVITDVKLPDINGIILLEEIKKLNKSIEVIILTAYGNITDAVKAIKIGAFDYLRKGDDDDKITFIVARAFEKINFQKQIEYLEDRIEKKNSFDKIIGNSSKIIHSIELAKKVALTNTTVLLLGETGTGKELFAEAIHNSSKRRSKPFIAINCAAIPRDLQESEFFGHKKGSFTGASYDKKGVLEDADTGTLLLDEIGEMDIDLQAKLLRAIETGSFTRIGDNNSMTVDIRIIAATNRNLFEDVSAGKFRKDLLYRLNMFTIEIPPLRDRKDDIEILIRHLTGIINNKLNKHIKTFEKNFINRLGNYSWPGNIRELKNVLERSIIICDGDILTESLLPMGILDEKSEDNEVKMELSSEDDSIEAIEKRHILKILSRTGNSKIETAKTLKIGLTTLYRKLKEYGIE